MAKPETRRLEAKRRDVAKTKDTDGISGLK